MQGATRVDPRTLYRVRKVAHSRPADGGPDILTFRLRYPRLVLAELNTHGQLNRVTESSRAIPVKLRVSQVRTAPYVPLGWGKNRPGMSSAQEIDGGNDADWAWLAAAEFAADTSERIAAMELHKQEANRVTEPFVFCESMVTATRWDNFFALRCHDTAYPAFRFMARAMYLIACGDVPSDPPKVLDYGRWHLPFIDEDDYGPAAAHAATYGVPAYARNFFADPAEWHLARWSAARVCRVSGKLLDRPVKPTPADDDKTWAVLVGDREHPADAARGHVRVPGSWSDELPHMSVTQHQATPGHKTMLAANPRLGSNVSPWIRLRNVLPNECAESYAVPEDVRRRWRAETPTEVFDGDFPR